MEVHIPTLADPHQASKEGGRSGHDRHRPRVTTDPAAVPQPQDGQ